jgi:hypothetical protein
MGQLVVRNLLLTACVVLACLMIGYAVGTVASIPYWPETSRTERAADGVSRRTINVYPPPSAYKEANEVRASVMWFCSFAGLAAAQCVFLVTHLREAPKAAP